MPFSIYNTDFQNWLKGILGLETTRIALCECISYRIGQDLKDIPSRELKQYFICLHSNGIYQIRSQSKGPIRWECRHERCNALMEHLINNHSNKFDSNYKWEESVCSNEEPNLGYQEEELEWKVLTLYMQKDKGEKMENYTSLKNLDISHLIKAMRNCKLFYPDGSEELYEKVLDARNTLMHSPDNMIKGKEIQTILKATRDLLICLDISNEDAMKELHDLEKKDFVIKYQSEESKQIIAKVLEARNDADELHRNISDDNKVCKEQSKDLQMKLENICGLGLATKEGLEKSPAEYKAIIREALEKKKNTIKLDIAECQNSTEDQKKLANLQQKTEQAIQEVEEVIKTVEHEEIAEVIPESKQSRVTAQSKTLFDRQLICKNLNIEDRYVSYAGKESGKLGLFVVKNDLAIEDQFEIEIVSMDTLGSIAIGVVPWEGYNENLLPGMRVNSVGFNSNGKVYTGKDNGKKYGDSWNVGDIIRCHISYGIESWAIIFLHNGKEIEVNDIYHGNHHFALGMMSTGDQVKITKIPENLA